MPPRTSKGPAQYDLPGDVVYVDIATSDGVSSRHPTNTVRNVDPSGEVNYMEFIDIDKPAARKWRDIVGIATGKEFKLGDGRFVLRDWPRNYQMYDHHKGPQHNPRHDIYLFGGPSKFRSPNEFVPHAIWLYGERKKACACKYCSKRPQKQITESMAAILPPTPTRLTPTFYYRSKPSATEQSRLKELRIYASVQQKLTTKAPKEVLKIPMLVERNQDLRAVHSQTSMALKRWYRDGEIVWCTLLEPIPGPKGLEDAIFLWPGLVSEANLRSVPVTVPVAGEGELPWTITQSIEYKVKLLAIDVMFTGLDTQVLPYQAFAPSEALIDAIINMPPSPHSFSRDSLSSFQFHIDGSGPSFASAYSAYALAIQIASLASGYWSLTDLFEFKCTIPPTHSPFAPQTTVSDTNQSGAGIEVNNHIELRRVPGQAPGLHPSGYLVSQTRAQGLWWGSERIWLDDMVRLKLPRKGFAPHGSLQILPPSGPGKAKLAELAKRAEAAKQAEAARRVEAARLGEAAKPVEVIRSQDSVESEDIGAGSRGLFMRLDSICTIDVPLEGGRIFRECRAGGMVYELADADWDGDGPSTSTAQSLHFTSTWSSSYALPDPPLGYKFRPILLDGYEAVVSLSLISGRYYPRILSHPLLAHTVAGMFEEGGLLDKSLCSLEGLAPGFNNAMDPTVYKPNRMRMLEDADQCARDGLQEYIQKRLVDLSMGEQTMMDTS